MNVEGSGRRGGVVSRWKKNLQGKSLELTQFAKEVLDTKIERYLIVLPVSSL